MASHGTSCIPSFVKSRIRFTGPDGAPYLLGQPMRVYEGSALLATLDPVLIQNGGTELHISDFSPTHAIANETRQIGRWIFFEICVFTIERFPQIQTIGFSFERPFVGPGSGVERAVSRARLLEQVGAVDVSIKLLTTGAHLVSGVWHYSEQNIASVRNALVEQRTIYLDAPIAERKRLHRWAGRILARLVFWRN